ncbi:MAG: ABC transporter ATP-binding protein [Planctomycetes bacterium]|nr:ABC transporter ATP-binding protein [Planctomycetota bacterium]
MSPSPSTTSSGDPAGSLPVELTGVHKSFGPHAVLRGVDLAVRRRETLVIIGRSGTGKSVALRHVVGLERPNRGEVRVFGHDIQKASRRQIHEIRSRTGFLFQSGALLNWMTIEENVALPLLEHNRRMPPDEVEDRVLAKLKLVGMESARRKLPAQISGGMKKRAALARATVLDPDLVLYDEPTSGLDPVIASTINELINRTREALGTTQIVVTHDMESAYSIADRIAMLCEGRIICLGTPQEIRSSDNPIVQQFIQGKTSGPLALES